MIELCEKGGDARKAVFLNGKSALIFFWQEDEIGTQFTQHKQA